MVDGDNASFVHFCIPLYGEESIWLPAIVFVIEVEAIGLESDSATDEESCSSRRYLLLFAK